MKTTWTMLIAIVLLVSGGWSVQDRGLEASFAKRLGQLEPTDPQSYFELAEEVAALAKTEDDRALAIRLFAMADQLDASRWRRSSILAIQPLVEDAAIARLLDATLRAWSNDVDLVPMRSASDARSDDAVMAAVDAISAFRRGDTKALRRHLAVEDATARLDAMASGLPGDSAWMLQVAKSKNFGRDSLNEDQVVATLEVQGDLLRSRHRPWSVVLQTKRGNPMTVIDPVPLTEIFGINPSHTRYRNGRWQ